MKTKRNLRYGIGILAALCFVASLFVPANAMAATQQNQVLSTNKWTNEYSWNWASTVKSDLTELSDGRYERVEWVSDALYVEHYSDSYRFLDAAKITASTYTPTGATQVIWGGYFAGSQFNFVVTGQSNDNDSDSIVVMRVTKYSKNWNYLGNVEYSGINTYDPFNGGSLRMTEMNGELWIRTCHKMYKASDGYHHQANMTFRIRESDLSKIDSETNVWNFDSSPMGYVSHSFNQFIVSTGSKIYSADHGDAYPRAIVAKDITPGGSKQAYYFINFKGQTGNNYTGSTLNGFETANNGASLIAAGTITDQNKAYSGGSSGAKNIWIGVAPTDGSQVSIKYLTNYEFDGNTTATDPALVKINENRFLALWSTKATNDSTHGPVQYVFIDGQGNTVSPVYNMNGALSDCQPIVAGDNVVWYTTGGSDNWWSSSEEAPTFYTINTSNGQSAAHDATQSHVVTFDSNGGSSVQSQNVRVGATATQPATPTRTGYTFQGWYTAKNGGTRYGFDKAVTGDMTLYARWAVITFRDVTSSTPHSADIAWIAEAGISTGWKEQDGSYTFRGMDTVKRQDMAAFLRRLAARDNITDAATWKPTEKDWNRFSDVNRNTPHAEDILWLAHAGISTGYPDGTFRGMVSVYRQDMAAFLHRLTLLAGKGSGAASQNFSDVTDATPHASDIRWLGGSGIAQGYPDGTFRGMTPVYRQDMAAFLHRLDTLVTR